MSTSVSNRLVVIKSRDNLLLNHLILCTVIHKFAVQISSFNAEKVFVDFKAYKHFIRFFVENLMFLVDVK